MQGPFHQQVVGLLCGLASLVSTGSVAAAQNGPVFFPHEVGDRWEYSVVGTTAVGDTLDAVAEWSVLAVRPGADVDTVMVRAVRREGRRAVTGTCRLIVSPGSYTFLADRSDVNETVCRAPGGFPFGKGLTTSYPFLDNLNPLGEKEIEVGADSYSVQSASARFRNDYSFTARPPYLTASTQVQASFAEGIGLVSASVIETENRSFVPTHRDTLRIRLLGAQVGGQSYGTLRSVQTDEGLDGGGWVRIGPNPTRGTVTVWTARGLENTPARVRVTDIAGRVVWEGTAVLGRPFELRLDSLTAGVYVVTVERAEGVVSRRVVLTR